jgi:hypothetical protein
MSATIIQFIPRPNPNREARQRALESQAIEIMNVALLGHPHDAAIYESSLGFIAPPEDFA